MSNELQKHKTGDKIKWILTLIAFILVGVMFAGILCGWFDKKQPAKDEQEQTSEFTGGAVISDTNEAHGIRLMSSIVAYADGGASAQSAESTYVITATVTPEEATNKRVTGALSWENSSSTWASGKSVSTYATVEQTSSGVFTLSVLKAFGEPIIFTVTSEDNSDITASCTVDYVKRVKAVTLNLTGTNVTSTIGNTKMISCADTFTAGYTVTYSDGTVTGTFTGGYLTTKLSDDLFNVCKKATTSGNWVFTQSSTTFLSANLSSVSSATVTSRACDHFISVTGNPGTGKSQWTQAFYNYVLNNSSSAHATLTMPYSYSFNGVGSSTGTASLGIMFRASSVAVAAANVELDTTHIYA